MVAGLPEGRSEGSHNPCCSFVDCPVARTVEGQHRTLCLEVARRSPDLKVLAGAFAFRVAVVSEMAGCQALHMNMAVQNGSHLMQQQCCIVLA